MPDREIEGLPHGKPSIPGTCRGHHRTWQVPPFHRCSAPPSAGQRGRAGSLTKKINGNSYEYDASIDSENDRILRNYARIGTYFAYFASMQDLRGSKRAGGKFDKNNAVFEIDWDLIIYDEAHEGTQTDLGQIVQTLLETPKNGKAPKILSLSGTPYNLIGQYEENVYTWDYVMEQRRKKEFAEQYPDLHNPYADLPEMRIYTFDLSKTMPTRNLNPSD